MRKRINISHVIIKNMGGHDQSQVKIKFKKFKKVKSILKMYQKVITMTHPRMEERTDLRPEDLQGIPLGLPQISRTPEDSRVHQ